MYGGLELFTRYSTDKVHKLIIDKDSFSAKFEELIDNETGDCVRL